MHAEHVPRLLGRWQGDEAREGPVEEDALSLATDDAEGVEGVVEDPIASLAAEMGRDDYTGTAEDNLWLHAQVFKALQHRGIPLP